MTNPFDDEKLYGARSALIKMTPDDQGRFEFDLWSQYTRLGLNALEVGDLVAVENYSTPDGERRTYSILTLTQVIPVHFATQGPDAYPGHVFESMRSIKEDWETQSDKPQHPTTTIISKAVSTGWQFSYNPRDGDLPQIFDENILPMVGAEIRPLSMEMVNAIINQGLESEPDSPFNHKKFDEINIRLDVESLLTTHFGIFGFTGVGKSNLVSSMVSELSSSANLNRANICLIDPNDEYLGLLIDKFQENPNDLLYIHVGFDSLPVPIIQGIREDPSEVPRAAIELLYRQLKLPAALKNNDRITPYIQQGLRNAITRTRIVLPAQDLSSYIQNEIDQQTPSGVGPDYREALGNAKEIWSEPYGNVAITQESIQEAIDFTRGLGGVRAQFQNLPPTRQASALSVIDRVIRKLNRLRDNLSEIPSNIIMSIGEITTLFNSEEEYRTIIITARRDSDIKTFVQILGNELYEARRRIGQIEPYTVFLFDEADLFIPNEGNENTRNIKDLCVTIARRGRKFGLGIGISTQRASLLDTEVMGNLHTYFISKLPRSYDRNIVAEAFGISNDQLSPTFTFRPGHWLIISHDATGLKGVPIPSTAFNANQRIIDAASRSRVE